MIDAIAKVVMRQIFHRFLQRQKSPLTCQEMVFKNLKHTFPNQVTANSYHHFIQQMPITTYNNYEQKILHEMQIGGPDLHFFCLTSGTTGKSKYIPYNWAMVEMFKRSQVILAAIAAQELDYRLFSDALFAWGSCPILEKSPSGVRTGYASGFFATLTPWFLKGKTQPSQEIQEIIDFDEKLAAFAKIKPSENIVALCGATVFLAQFLEEYCKKKGVETLADLWPNLKFVMYGASYIGPYKAKFEKLAGKKLEYLGWFASSEASLGFEVPSLSRGQGHYILNLDDILFAFKLASGEILGIDQLQVGCVAELLISTPNGFINYSTTDLVKIVAVRPYLLVEPLGRINVAINLATEKTTERQIDQSIARVYEKMNLGTEYYFVYPSFNQQNRPCYEWVFATDHQCDHALWADYLDQALMSENEVYKSVRYEDRTVAAPIVKVIPKRIAADFIASQVGRGQFKLKKIFNSRKEMQTYLGMQQECYDVVESKTNQDHTPNTLDF